MEGRAFRSRDRRPPGIRSRGTWRDVARRLESGGGRQRRREPWLKSSKGRREKCGKTLGKTGGRRRTSLSSGCANEEWKGGRRRKRGTKRDEEEEDGIVAGPPAGSGRALV